MFAFYFGNHKINATEFWQKYSDTKKTNFVYFSLKWINCECLFMLFCHKKIIRLVPQNRSPALFNSHLLKYYYYELGF